jgi:spoIIIJ-associated protein
MDDSQESLEIQAPTLEEALAQAASRFGVDEDALEIEIIEEGTKGLFGLGSRSAHIRVRPRSEDPRPPSEPVATRTALDRPAAGPEAIEEADDDEIIEVARDTVIELLQRMGVQSEVHAHWADKDPHARIRPLLIDISGRDLSILIGRRGQTLSALQYITRLIVSKELKRPVAVVIDVEGYRARRERQLRQLARRMAQQAIELGRTMSLEPMPPNERRIIHIELRANTQVNTESVGEGDQRKVTIIPA